MSSTARIRLRRDTQADWTSANPTLLDGEMGIETDTRRFKVGDGSTAWSSLNYYIEGVLARGQASRQTSGSITIATASTYQSTGLTATFDDTTDHQTTLGTTDSFAIRNTSGATKLFMVQASMDATAGNNQTLGIKLALNGTGIDQSECRAFTSSNDAVAKLFCFWMVEMDNNDEVALHVANIGNTTAIAFQRGRISAIEVKA